MTISKNLALLVAALAACHPAEPVTPPAPSPPPTLPAPPPAPAEEAAAEWLGSEVRYASERDAARLLAESDEYTRAMGAFERHLRRGEATDEAGLLAYAGTQALPWRDEDREMLAPILK